MPKKLKRRTRVRKLAGGKWVACDHCGIVAKTKHRPDCPFKK